MMRTEDADRERLLRAAQEHVREEHGKEFSIEEIEEEYVKEVEA
jgi:hypothetical protein